MTYQPVYLCSSGHDYTLTTRISQVEVRARRAFRAQSVSPLSAPISQGLPAAHLIIHLPRLEITLPTAISPSDCLSQIVSFRQKEYRKMLAYAKNPRPAHTLFRIWTAVATVALLVGSPVLA